MPNKVKRNPQINVVVSKEIKEKFEAQAKKKGLTVQSWLRMLGFEDIARNDF